MPIGEYPDFDACVRAQVKKGKSQKSAKRICGYLEKKMNKGVDAQDAIDKYNDLRGRDEAKVYKSKTKTDLPDAAFAYIEPGGKKDETGKTIPRSKRHLPHHTSSVKSPTEHSSVDKPHLRNALARVGQTSIPAAAKSRAKAHLIQHAKALGIGDYEKKSK